MKPAFLTEIEEAFAVQKHVILTLNTEDRFYFPEEGIHPSNLNYFLASYFTSRGYHVAQYAPTLGIRELSPSGNQSPALNELARQTDPMAIFNGVIRLMRNPQERWIILILHAERIASRSESGSCQGRDGMTYGEIMHTLGLDDAVALSPSRLVLVTYSSLPEDLITRSRGYRLVEVGLPTQDERKSFIDFLSGLVRNGQTDIGTLQNDLNPDELSRLTAGMPLSGIEAAYRQSGHFRQPITREQIRLSKAREIRNLARDLLDVSEPQEGFEGVAGLASIKSYLRDLIPQIKAGRAGVPQAFLLQGVPGCGKSHLVKALAKELGWPLLELRNVRNPFVGQSEMNLDHVIRVVEQLQPAILFFDEIDQTLGQRGTGTSGDSGTSERMLARIFTWLGSLHMRGKLLFLGATNRPDILDAAMLDRFGVSIPFLKPGIEEIRELIPMLLNRFERSLAATDIAAAVSIFKSLSITGREIQEIVIEAGLRADQEDGHMGADICCKHLVAAVNDQIRREDVTEMEFMALVSLSICSSQSLLPWNDRNGLRTGAVVPQMLLETGVAAEDGRLDQGKLQQAIFELKHRRHAERVMR